MIIGGFQKFSMIDFPGHICATIFTQGCNFRCPYCHNPELVLPEQFETPIPESEIFSFLTKRIGKLDGVTITGGEPTLHADLPDFIQKIRQMGFLIKLDTNGTNPEMIQYLIENHLVDYIAMDYKGPINRYELTAGVHIDPEKIIESIQIIKNSEILYEFRTTILDELLNKEDIFQMKEELNDNKNYIIQNFVVSKILNNDFYGCHSLNKLEIDSLNLKVRN